jgi:hypothetical protein
VPVDGVLRRVVDDVNAQLNVTTVAGTSTNVPSWAGKPGANAIWSKVYDPETGTIRVIYV